MNEEGLMSGAELLNEEATQPEEISHLQEDVPSTDGEVSASEQEPEERPEWYPEKFWKDGNGDTESLAKSYNELQKKFSQGKHKAPEEYDEAVFKDAEIPEDDELYNVYKDWAKENGISQQAFDDLASKFVEMGAAEADLGKISYEEEYKKLGPNADATIKSMTEWAQGLERKGVISGEDFEEYKIMCGTAQGLKVMQKIRSYYGDRPIPIDTTPVSGLPSKDELNAMVTKPEYLSDPIFRAKVEKMFEQVYGSQEASAI